MVDRYRNNTLHLIILPTEDCNFRCVYCYELFKHKKMSPTIRKRVKLFVERRAPELKSLHVSWFGGEPLEAIDVIEELSHSFQQHSLNFSASITTNGYNLVPSVARLILDLHIDHFQITLDGPPQEHNKRRKHLTGRGTFERIFQNLLDLKALSDPYMVLIRVNVDRENMRFMPEFVDFLAKNFSDDHRFSICFRAISRWGGPNDSTLPICSDKDRHLISLHELAANKGLRVNLFYYLLQPGGYVCYAAWPYSLVIRADGRINKCTVSLEDEINQVGRILPNGDLILDGEKFSLWTTSDESQDKVCQKCFLRPVCQGSSCPLRRIRSGERPCPPEKPSIRRVLSILSVEAMNYKNYKRKEVIHNVVVR